MNKKYLLILLVICIFGGLYYVAQLVQEPAEVPPPIAAKPNEVIPEKGFKELQLTYYGETQQYRMETLMQEIIEESRGEVKFKGMEAVLKDGEKVLQQFITPEGQLVTKAGAVRLDGPVVLKAGDYQLSMNTVNVDLNAGRFHAMGLISLVSSQVLVEAGEMDADFQLHKIHFKGRPKLIVKKGG